MVSFTMSTWAVAVMGIISFYVYHKYIYIDSSNPGGETKNLIIHEYETNVAASSLLAC